MATKKFDIRKRSLEKNKTKESDQSDPVMRLVVGGDDEGKAVEKIKKEKTKQKASKILTGEDDKSVLKKPKTKSSKTSKKIEELIKKKPKENQSTVDFTRLVEDTEKPDGYVKRNFAISRYNMGRVKTLVQLANENGIRVTQDDVINQLLDERFEELKIK